MKNAEKFLKTYEEIADESFKKWGYYYPPKTWDEFNARNNNFYEKYLKDKENGVLKTKSYIRLAETMNDFGFYDLYQNFDFVSLNNILFQTSRQSLLNRGILASGTDHCNVLMDTLCCFSCNDFEVIDYFFPKNLPHSKGKYYTEVSVNLLKVLYFNETQKKEEALIIAEKFLSKKITAWEKYVVLYFKALIEQNGENASSCLQELCLAYQKMEHSVSKLHNKLAKYFAPEIHGLYRFAKIINQDLFNDITQPKHLCFSEEFEKWQKENNYPKGKIFYPYPQEMDYMNKIFEAELPTVSLHKPYPNKNNLYKDVDKFATDLTENVVKRYNE
jgi:hypothetical protein